MKNGQIRPIIENIRPQISNAKYPIKRVVGQSVEVAATIYADGHDILLSSVSFKHVRGRKWVEIPMKHTSNDEFICSFPVEKQGLYKFRVNAWIDYALTWRYGLKRKHEDGQDITVELNDGKEYFDHLKEAGKGSETKIITQIQSEIASGRVDEAVELILSSVMDDLMHRYPYRPFIRASNPDLEVYVDRKKALFSAWYEFFPRSASSKAGQHGTFEDCIKLLPRIAELGFDTIYFPPIHPIGEQNRKGKNNAENAENGDVGSPWAIGSKHGGHKAIHPDLGDLNSFKKLIKAAEKHGIEIAMDFAIQCAPDHPYVKEHPEWFKWRSDGTVQYAENPPKKYQDILPIYFETDDWKNLWKELVSIIQFWVDQGISIFRVDNPHTKPVMFWEYLISEIKKKHPEVLFLSEAFTKPSMMHGLAKIGFTQSYTYYSWRESKRELVEYMEELTHGPGSEYFRPNFWPNTPDINPFYLQDGNLSRYLSRYFMAGTLSSNYGVYGPVYQFIDYTPYPDKEEYANSEKYEIRHWKWKEETPVTDLMRRLNHIRKDNPALQQTNLYQHCQIENDHLFAYVKWNEDKDNLLLMVVNLDPWHRQEGWVQLPLDLIGVQEGDYLQMHDLLTGNNYTWNREWNYVALNPDHPYHLFEIEK